VLEDRPTEDKTEIKTKNEIWLEKFKQISAN